VQISRNTHSCKEELNGKHSPRHVRQKHNTSDQHYTVTVMSVCKLSHKHPGKNLLEKIKECDDQVHGNITSFPRKDGSLTRSN